MIARYDLKYEQPGFDYFGWQVVAVGSGATEIVFGTRNIPSSPIWSQAQLRERFESIIAPGPELSGLKGREGDGGERLDTAPKNKFKLEHLVRFVRRRGCFRRLVSVLPHAHARYTVTLRQQSRKSRYRNSDEKVWRIFAAEIGAVVIEDYDVKPIHLHERMALYAGAEMNFGVASGPMFLCTLTPYPCMSFDWGLGPQEQVLTLSGIAKGSRMPWCDRDQFTFWQPDDLDIIRRRFDDWLRGTI
jgi:hypothetical protein